ncbi:MAG TPA: cell division protein ZapA [Qipengyuania sp.]|nr:cell division protein ZapA [Qipengyuania sp.]
MSEITLQVGGRAYTVSCADGEEDHVRHLASVIDGKLAGLGGNRAPGDAKNLLFAALILADEVEETRRNNGVASAGDGAAREDAIARGLEAVADKLESLASSLESAGANA